MLLHLVAWFYARNCARVRAHVHKQTHSPDTNNFPVHMLMQQSMANTLSTFGDDKHFAENTRWRKKKTHRNRTKTIQIFSMSVVGCWCCWFCAFISLGFSVCWIFAIEIYTKCSHKHVLLHLAECIVTSCALKIGRIQWFHCNRPIPSLLVRLFILFF